MPTVTQTFQSLIQQISSDLNDLITGTASGGSTTTLTDTGEVARYPAGSLVGAEISTISGTGSGQSTTITGHTVSSGTATFTVPTWTAVDSTTAYEIHRLGLNGRRGFTRKQYQDAVYAVIDALADYEWTDHDLVSLAVERHLGAGAGLGIYRREYPMPSGFNGVFGVDVLSGGPAVGLGVAALDTFRALGDATARTRISQGFQVPETGFYNYLPFYMDKVGAPTDNLTCVVETDSSGLPSGTAVTNGTSTAIAGTVLATTARYLVFVFAPMLLTADTQYHATLRRSAAVDASNYYRVGEDSGGGYADGGLSLRDATTWTAVAGSDLIFAVNAAGAAWVPLGPKYWDYQPQATDQLVIKRPDLWAEGRPIRVRGGAAIARPSAESTAIPARPEYVAAAAKALLTLNQTGQASNNGFFQALGMTSPARRPFPADWVAVRS